jgi:nitrous oxide reductase accessory protein NosL
VQRARFLLTLALGTALLMGCGRSEQTSPTPTVTGTVSPTATGSPSGDGDIRAVDFTDPGVTAAVIRSLGGGEVNPDRITYADFTGDGAEDAVVVIESGGTMGDLGAALFTMQAGAPRLLGTVEHGGRVEVRFAETGRGLIASITGSYAAGDPQCCPSRLHERVYQWTGDRLELITDQEVPNPNR